MTVPLQPQIVYIPHGGGPLPILGGYDHNNLITFLKDLPKQLRRPKKILVISAHWEASSPTLTANPKPEMIYDYHGFPEAAYKLEYPASGLPDFASDLQQSLKALGLPLQLDATRGNDHGAYIPLMLLYPEADIPCMQLSLVDTLDPQEHIALGQALGKVLTDDVLVIGSGMSFHNMGAFGEGKSQAESQAFGDWLAASCVDPNISPDKTMQRLIEWQKAPEARYCHPREEHLLPLHVCFGMAYEQKSQGKLIFDASVLGQRCLAFLWH